APARWLLWDAGRLRYWRTGIGEAWRRQVGDPAAAAIDAQLVLDGRLLVLVQRRGDVGRDTLRLTVAQAYDGAQNLPGRLPNVTRVAIAARSGVALAWQADEGRLFNLRFGRWIRELRLPEGVEDIVVDDGLEHVALVFPHSVEIADIDSLAAGRAAAAAESAAEDASANGQIAALPATTVAEVPESRESSGSSELPGLPGLPGAKDEPAPAPVTPALDHAPLPDEPLVRLEP